MRPKNYLNEIRANLDQGAQTMYLLTKWEGRTGKYLARGHGVRAERNCQFIPHCRDSEIRTRLYTLKRSEFASLESV